MYKGPGKYRHYKGPEYLVLGLALREDSINKSGHFEVGETFVIYKPLTPGSILENRKEDFWARRLDDFNKDVLDEDGSHVRFTCLEEDTNAPR